MNENRISQNHWVILVAFTRTLVVYFEFLMIVLCKILCHGEDIEMYILQVHTRTRVRNMGRGGGEDNRERKEL